MSSTLSKFFLLFWDIRHKGQGFFPNLASNIKRFNLINFLFFLKWSESLWFLMILGEIDVD